MTSDDRHDCATTRELPDLAATAALAADLLPCLRPGDVIALRGDLGAGKTEFARALIRAATADPDAEVPSPTFTLLQTYDAPLGAIHHFDLYRLRSPADLEELGWDDSLVEALVLVEWPDRAGPFLPARRLDLTLDTADDSPHRRATLRPMGNWANDREGVAALQRQAEGE